MCGHDWCAVRISKEIGEFLSGKEAAYAWNRPRVSGALSPEQSAILEQRGVLDPDTIRRLATKTRGAMVEPAGAKPACHSDSLNATEAERLQTQRLDPVTLESASPPAE
jgi:phosphomethylpyrimidine synthase